MALLQEEIDLQPDPSYPFHILATRYNYEHNPHANSDDAFTLIFLHALLVHKETWEVTVARIFAHCGARGPVKIRDVFSIESPNHGRSSAVNAEALSKQMVTNWPREYGRATQRFLTAGPSAGAPVDFKSRKLIGISHSIGAVALFLAAQSDATIPFKAMIAFEPGVTDKDNLDQRIRATSAASAYAWLRPNVFASRKAARRELAKSPMFSGWDARILELFVEYGLVAHPASQYPPPFTFPGLRTGLSREDHAHSYMSEDITVQGLEAYSSLTQKMPVHLVWGSIDELANDDLKNFLSSVKDGRTPVSVSKIDGASHMVVQQKPDVCAEKVVSILMVESQRNAKARL
ncbi:Alpha/beta hydrolase fold-1 [Mycena pura]|uniref:Alpha/beta hydrolase fold-1 n=1 Tax=Mycena pura TaxID=153505 RepID=A0AAD6VTA3_9AGAR|nr:Alpha/beta hydrolase fold-1 [Mycena pura]